jgi:ectoine hydroxylase-related dioxygenase (phytanoyl-CoA dioxygenase family)
VIRSLVSPATLGRLSIAYDQAFELGAAPDLRRSSSGSDLRLAALLGRDRRFDELSTLPPVLEACEQVVGAPFKLSSMTGRTVLLGANAQALHVDVRREDDAWPLLGFILMLDEFRVDNGGTRFVPGSHELETSLCRCDTNARSSDGREVVACGPAGSVIVYHGSTWHGHGDNRSGAPRRSMHGAYIPRRGTAATDWAARLAPEALARLPPPARRLLAG